MKILAAVAFLAVSVSAEYYTTASITKQADGTYQIVFPINDWQANPAAAAKDLANKTVTFGKDVTVCATLYSGTKKIKQGNHMLVTVTNWTKYQAVGTLYVPDGVNVTKVLVWCSAPAGEAKATNGCMLLNPKDPSYTPEGYVLKVQG